MDAVQQRQLAALAVCAAEVFKWIHWAAITAAAAPQSVGGPTAVSDAAASALLLWTVLWTGVEIAVVLAIAAARIPKMTLTPGRALAIIIALCFVTEAAGGSLVPSA